MKLDKEEIETMRDFGKQMPDGEMTLSGEKLYHLATLALLTTQPPVKDGGETCPRCKGKKIVHGPCPDNKPGCCVIHFIDCPTCNGSGKLPQRDSAPPVKGKDGGEGV